MNMQSPRDASKLDERLSAAFAGLDTGPDFDARLLARIATESQMDTAPQALRALRLEQARYCAARRDLLSWKHELRAILRLMTLDTLGAGVLAVVAAFAIWSQIGPLVGRQLGPELVEELRQNAQIVLPSMLGLIIGLVPLIAVSRRVRSRVALSWDP